MRRSFPRALKGVSAALLLVAAAPASAPVLREIAWTDPAADPAHIATHRPGECMGRTDVLVETGRALFRSPQLLGGPAARAGLSCESCHTEGRANAHFLLPELTDRPGMADVTSEWASKVRGDGIANPVAIPDLVGVSRKETFGSHGEKSLETFVRSVIVDEFQGHEPPPRAIAGLMAYLGALDPVACAPDGRVTLSSTADEVRRAVAAARASAEAGEPEATRALLLAARDAMARLAERLPSPAFNEDRRRLEALSRELGAADAAVVLGPAWMARFDATVARVKRRERRTYFNPDALRSALIKGR